MLLNLEKEIALLRVGASFLEQVQIRHEAGTSVGAAMWYEDMAWGMRLFVEQGVPFFGGENAASWLTVAEQFENRANFYKDKLQFVVPKGEDDASGVLEALNWIERFKRITEFMINVTQTEFQDVSGLLPSGQKGITVGEAVKLARMFTAFFWNYSYRMSNSNSNKVWLAAVVNDLMAAQKALGEPMHAGDLGSGGDTPPGYIPPFSWGGGQ